MGTLKPSRDKPDHPYLAEIVIIELLISGLRRERLLLGERIARLETISKRLKTTINKEKETYRMPTRKGLTKKIETLSAKITNVEARVERQKKHVEAVNKRREYFEGLLAKWRLDIVETEKKLAELPSEETPAE